MKKSSSCRAARSVRPPLPESSPNFAQITSLEASWAALSANTLLFSWLNSSKESHEGFTIALQKSLTLRQRNQKSWISHDRPFTFSDRRTFWLPVSVLQKDLVAFFFSEVVDVMHYIYPGENRTNSSTNFWSNVIEKQRENIRETAMELKTRIAR